MAKGDKKKDLEKKIERLLELHEKSKLIDEEAKELKAFFKEEADKKGGSCDFLGENAAVSVNVKTKNALDKTELRKLLTEDVLASCHKTSSYQEVTVRRIEA